MIIFVALALTVLAFAFIAYPLLRRRWQSGEAISDETLRELHSKRDTTYSMLKELEFDYQSGILTEEDYQDLETRYKKKAISLLKEIDSTGKSSVEEAIEKQVLELRQSQRLSAPKVTPKVKRKADVADEIEKEVLELRGGQRQFCPQCGRKYQDSDRFCSYCGAKLRK